MCWKFSYGNFTSSFQPILFILEEFETFLTSQGKSYASMQSNPYEIKGMEFDTKLEGKNHLGGESKI